MLTNIWRTTAGVLSPYALTREAAMWFAAGTLIHVFRRRTPSEPEAPEQPAASADPLASSRIFANRRAAIR